MDGGETGPTPVTARLRASRRRPPRASRACETCRARKTKCDQAQPCSYCAYHSLDCVYRNVGADQGHSTAARRQSQIREVQRERGRPSPWPEATQSLPQGSRTSHSPDRVIDDAPAARAARYGPNNRASSPVAPTPRSDIHAKIASPSLCDSASREGLSGVNLHTKGTEFYGTSSNFAFLENLYARARNQGAYSSGGLEAENPSLNSNLISDSTNTGPNLSAQSSRNRAIGSETEVNKTTADKSQLSIVNLLYNPTYASHSPIQPSSAVDNEDQTRNGPRSFSRNPGDDDNTLASVIGGLPQEAQIEIEKIFIGSYFSNKHYIHPMLCKESFMQRCEDHAFTASRRAAFCRGSSKFSGLYFAVVALGAINASPNETALLDHYCNYSPSPRAAAQTARPTVLDFADFYFGVAKRTLGDVFESCSLEIVQALLLLSVFCQNALRPHTCYMYSGMAVRTAVAIGLASGISSLPPGIRKEGIRTWWCIYSHEVEMCCSSGRLDSVKELSYYPVPLPIIQVNQSNPEDSNSEGNDVAMIPVMVSLARIMSEASHLLYHSPKRSTGEMSQIALKLEDRLLVWKSTLPDFLNVDAASLNDPEWAFKQKLVLRLRYYNTRILIHRPFLAASTSSSDNPTLLHHLRTCLGAAQASIQMQYEAFLHRIYIRTWWYNTTYALYAAMILLHVVLSGYPGIRDEELLADVERSLDIFGSMNNIVVARRCSEMIREVLEVARACATRRQSQSKPVLIPTSNAAFSVDSSNLNANTTGIPSPGGDGGFFFSLFNHDSQPDTRANMLANLVDPTILENFAFGSGWNDFSLFLEPGPA